MKQADTKDSTIIRASVSFPHSDYKKVEKIAADKHVSVAWVVREAVIEYLKKAKGE